MERDVRLILWHGYGISSGAYTSRPTHICVCAQSSAGLDGCCDWIILDVEGAVDAARIYLQRMRLELFENSVEIDP